MGVAREDPETGITHDVSVAPMWGMVPAACGHMPKYQRWSSKCYVHVECDDCLKVIEERREIERQLRNFTPTREAGW